MQTDRLPHSKEIISTAPGRYSSQGGARAKEEGKSKRTAEGKGHLYILGMSFTINLHRYLYRYDREVKAHSSSSVSCVSRMEVMVTKKSSKCG